ncbi:hypothetical protein TNCV_3136521 [Trichonephila clavipes]|nr:hypothetical protein TNCV_3136521 [Trichonephila clavipes]
MRVQLFSDVESEAYVQKLLEIGEGHLDTDQERNRDYTGMWVRLGSTDLMAGKVMFLRSNQGDRLDDNESVADSFRSDLVGFKSWSGRILGAFLPSYVCQSGSEQRYPRSPLRHSYSHQISTTLVKFNVSLPIC